MSGELGLVVIECHLKGHSPAETPLVYSCIFLYIEGEIKVIIE